MAHSIFCCYASESQFFFHSGIEQNYDYLMCIFFLSDSDAYWMWVCVIMREHKLCLPSVCDFSLSLVGFKYSVLLCSPLQWVRIDNTQTRDLCVLTVRHLYSFVFVPFIVLCIISYQPKRFAFALKTFDNLVCLSSISGPNSGLIE